MTYRRHFVRDFYSKKECEMVGREFEELTGKKTAICERTVYALMIEEEL